MECLDQSDCSLSTTVPLVLVGGLAKTIIAEWCLVLKSLPSTVLEANESMIELFSLTMISMSDGYIAWQNSRVSEMPTTDHRLWEDSPQSQHKGHCRHDLYGQQLYS